MGNCYRIILTIFICALFAVIVIAQDDNTEDLPPEGNIVLVDSAFVRSGPGDDYVAVGALFAGDAVFPLNISEDGQWILIPYSRSNGWIQRNLVRWEDEAELNQLPILIANVTPTPRIAITNTPFIPTQTPEGSYVNVEGAASAYVRAGPGRGYLRLGQILPGENVEALARNEDTSWIMIRFSNEELIDGFGWLALELVYWEDLEALEELPIVQIDDLTPTVTFTPSPTASITPTETATEIASSTATNTVIPESILTNTAIPSDIATPSPEPINTATRTATPEATVTNTPIPSDTPTLTATASPTDVPSATAMLEPTITNTAIPSDTATSTATNTPIPSDTPTSTVTNTAIPSETATSTATNTPIPSDTPTSTVTNTPTNTLIPSNTPTLTPTATNTPLPTNTSTEIVEAAVIASDTITASPSHTPTITVTATESVTDIFAIQATSVAAEATNSASEAPEPSILEEIANEGNSNRIPIEAIVGVILLLIVLIYIWFYWQGLSAIGRYTDGFVVEDCPVCQRGNLHIDERQSRTFGIPTVRRTIRCDVCRSVLRETRTQRWRYAVDRIENPTMYDRFNGREVNDADLERLAKTPPSGAKARTSPEFDE